MDNEQAVVSHGRDTADVLYEVLAGKAVSERRLAQASAWFEKLGTSLDRRSFMSYMQALQRELPAGSPLAELALRWRGARVNSGGFSERDAGAFLQDYLDHLDPNLLFRAPITAGYAHWDADQLRRGFSYAIPSEQAWSLLYCTRGGARLWASGRDLSLLPGRVLLVAPGALYTLQPLPGCRVWEYYWTVFLPDSRWRDWLKWPRFATHVGSLSLSGAAREPVRRVFGELESCLQAAVSMSTELSHNLLEQLILRCRASLPPDIQSHRDPRIERAREYIERHYNEAFTLEEVARAARMSASRLASLFRAQCGLNVLGYRDELRMVHAAQLLRNSALGIAAIGAEVGYPDAAYFSRTFNRHVGVSPREYRKQG